MGSNLDELGLFLHDRIGVKLFGFNGGPGGVRTLDLMTASHARSQLRHRPTSYVMTGGSILPYCTFVGKVGIRLSKLPPVKVL